MHDGPVKDLWTNGDQSTQVLMTMLMCAKMLQMNNVLDDPNMGVVQFAQNVVEPVVHAVGKPEMEFVLWARVLFRRGRELKYTLIQTLLGRTMFTYLFQLVEKLHVSH